jgi:hypothetical protein
MNDMDTHHERQRHTQELETAVNELLNMLTKPGLLLALILIAVAVLLYASEHDSRSAAQVADDLRSFAESFVAATKTPARDERDARRWAELGAYGECLCGENEPHALTRARDGTIRCWNCIAKSEPPRGEPSDKCIFCGEDDPRCIERHHTLGRKVSAETMPVCKNCHARLTDAQQDWPPEAGIAEREVFSLRDTLELSIKRRPQNAYFTPLAPSLPAGRDGKGLPPKEVHAAIRACVNMPPPDKKPDWKPNGRPLRLNERFLIFDTETTTDENQRLRVGGFLLVDVKPGHGEGGLIVSDGLPPEDYRTVLEYGKQHNLPVLTGREFVEEVFYPEADKGTVIVGFNLPFDLSRLASADPDRLQPRNQRKAYTVSRGKHRDTFTLRLSPNPALPDIRIKPLSAHGAMIEFIGSKRARRKRFSGRFLDLHTAVFALAGEAHSLRSAGRALGAKIIKQEEPAEHGSAITAAYLDYLVRDVKATAALLDRILEIYDRYPFATYDPEYSQKPEDTPLTKLYSPGSVAKAFLRKMNVSPSLPAQKAPPEYRGYAISAFYGGRFECTLRKVLAPVVTLDYSSQYPTVYTIMQLHNLAIAAEYEIVRCHEEAIALCERIRRNPDLLLDRNIWASLVVFVKVSPHEDYLPVRAAFSGDASNVNICVTTVSAGGDVSLWYSMADIAASVLETGKAPRILDAFRVVPTSRQILNTIEFAGVRLDPHDPNLIAEIVAHRKRVEKENPALAWGLKILANCATYGILSETDPELFNHADEKRTLNILWSDQTTYDAIGETEHLGRFANPFIASHVTAGGRLLLAIAEKLLRQRGCCVAWVATDSMTVVTTQAAAGVYGTPDWVKIPAPSEEQLRERYGVRPATHEDIAYVQNAVNMLNPYPRDVIPQLLKREDVKCGWGYSISPNRYCIIGRDGELKHWTEHGLGALITPNGESLHDFARTLWIAVLTDETPLEWERTLARRKVPIRTPTEWKLIREYYPDVTPFNFLQRVKPAWVLGNRRLTGEWRALYAPFRDTDKASLKLTWIAKRPDGTTANVKVKPAEPEDLGTISYNFIPVETLYSLCRSFANHTDPRMITPQGEMVRGNTAGVLRTQPLLIKGVYPIGREHNRLEDEADDLPELITLFTGDPEINQTLDNTCNAAVQNAIEKLTPYPNDLVAKALGVSPRAWKNYKSGARQPGTPTARKIIAVSVSLPDIPPPTRADRRSLILNIISQLEKTSAPCDEGTLQQTREIIGTVGLRAYAKAARIDPGHLSAALNGKRPVPKSWLPQLAAANRQMMQSPSAGDED